MGLMDFFKKLTGGDKAQATAQNAGAASAGAFPGTYTGGAEMKPAEPAAPAPIPTPEPMPTPDPIQTPAPMPEVQPTPIAPADVSFDISTATSANASFDASAGAVGGGDAAGI